MRRSKRGPEHEFVVGGRRWIRTSGLLHVKRFRLSAVLGAWEAERNRLSYTVTKHGMPGGNVVVRMSQYANQGQVAGPLLELNDPGR